MRWENVLREKEKKGDGRRRGERRRGDEVSVGEMGERVVRGEEEMR